MNTVLSNQLVFQNTRGILARRAPGARAEAPARRVPALRQAGGGHVATRMWPLHNASFFVFFQGLKLTPMPSGGYPAAIWPPHKSPVTNVWRVLKAYDIKTVLELDCREAHDV
jgi:hypothetical protein